MLKIILPSAIAGCILINCIAVGAYQFYTAYQEWRNTPVAINLDELSDSELNQISKQAFVVQQDRRKDNR